MKESIYAMRCRAAILLLATGTLPVLSQTTPASSATASKPAAQKPVSAGLVNDWLRDESDAFKQWDIGGQFRIRYEAKENAGYIANRDFAQDLDNSNDYFLFRTKVHLGWTPANWFTAFVEGRDSHAVSDERALTETDVFDLHQAFISLGNAKQFPLLLKVGRQELLYGDERFIGIGDWSNVGRSFDAVELRFENETFWVDAFGGRQVLPYDERFNVANDYDWFSGIYASTRKLVPWQETQLYFLARNVGAQAPNAITPGFPGTPTTARDVYTIGTRWKSLPGKLGAWDYTAEIAGQFGGVVQSGVRRDLQALAADATFGYMWAKVFGTPRLGLGYTYASGDSDSTDDKAETFEPLFGTNHKFYGVMDLWGLRNIQSGRVVGSIKPLKQLTLSTECHLIWLADTQDLFYPESGSGRSGNGYGRNPYDSFVGTELDVLASYAATSYADFQVGYGHFFVGDYIKQSVNSVPANGGTTDADWIYMQVRFNF